MAEDIQETQIEEAHKERALAAHHQVFRVKDEGQHVRPYLE